MRLWEWFVHFIQQSIKYNIIKTNKLINFLFLYLYESIK